MQFRISIIIALAALVSAGVLHKKDIIEITEVLIKDSNGQVVSSILTTITLPGATPTSALAQTQATTPAVPAQDPPVDVVSFMQKQVDSSVRTKTGFVQPTDPLFPRMAIFHTNAHRANSSIPALRWNSTLAQKAQAWANLCTGDEELGRPDGTGVNAAWSSSADFNPSDFISDCWYNGELSNYPWNKGDNVDVSGPAFNSYGHVSQLLWNTTTSFGCGIKNNCGGSWKSHALCYYSPPGNYIGQFSKVKRPGRGPVLRANGK